MSKSKYTIGTTVTYAFQDDVWGFCKAEIAQGVFDRVDMKEPTREDVKKVLGQYISEEYIRLKRGDTFTLSEEDYFAIVKEVKHLQELYARMTSKD